MKIILFIFLLVISKVSYSQNIEGREDFLGVINKEIKKSRCNETGKVVIEISINSKGLVIETKYIEGEFKISKCLIDEAMHHAKNLQFVPNKGAPEVQTTRVFYDIKADDK